MEDRSLGVGRRDYKDRRPGTPIPFHEPHPDRHAISDAIRAKLEREKADREARSAAYKTEENKKLSERGRETHVIRSRETLAERLAKTDIPNPPRFLVSVPLSDAFVRATREDKTMYFDSVSSAARCFIPTALDNETLFTVEARYVTVLRSLLRDGNGEANVFGWHWEQLRRARKRKSVAKFS